MCRWFAKLENILLAILAGVAEGDDLLGIPIAAPPGPTPPRRPSYHSDISVGPEIVTVVLPKNAKFSLLAEGGFGL